MLDNNTWPPEQPASFVPLLLVCNQGHRTPEEVTTMAKLMYSGDIDKAAPIAGDQPVVKHAKLDSTENLLNILRTSKTTKDIEEVLAPLEISKEPTFILVEGGPGFGKSVLLKEIAYRWGKKQLLQKVKIVLLVCLRDPSLQQTKSVSNLLRLFYKGDENATEVVSACSECLSKNGGNNVILLLDGYDEYPRKLQESSLIADILKRHVLPLCGLVVSSRPHASEHLRTQANMRVDILGFAETERDHYIKKSLSDQPHKIQELTQYLIQRPSIDSICFIPFNMVILLYLFKLGTPLPNKSAKLYQYFICSTICRHLHRFGNPLACNITDLTNLPEPYNAIIKQLARLSLEALNGSKLIFSLDEIIATCPDIATIPGTINGFGLLQAVQHFGLYSKAMTMNFIHFTIQEFLAAYHISNLPPDEELEVIKENFWKDSHFNVFSIYLSLTRGQQLPFKQFLSSGNKAVIISHEFLSDQLKCLHLYHCFNQADDHTMCNAIDHAETFESKEIKLGGATLTANDIECISLFLTSSSNRNWEWINLNYCYIRDKGLNILHRGLRHSGNVNIYRLWLDNNGLTAQSSPLVSELTVKCKVKVLGINDNCTIGENQLLYSMLTNPLTMLEELHLYYTKLSSEAAVALFRALKNNIKLELLLVDVNDINDDACDAITGALKENVCLVTLSMHENTMSSKTIINIVQCLNANNTIQLLGLPKCSQDVQKNIKRQQEVINRKRESCGYQANLMVKFDFVWQL